MLGFGHVDKVNHNDAAHVTQTQLTRYFIGSTQIDFKGIALLVGSGTASVARVHVNDMQCFRMLDNDIGSGAE